MSDKQWTVRREPLGAGHTTTVVEVGGGVVALVKNCGGRKEENARRIAAAPDMLAALEAQKQASDYAADLAALSNDGTRLTESHLARGRDLIASAKELRAAAIAKATGA